MKIDLSVLKREPDYKGSVQNLYFIDDEFILCETTTGGSVFDVGTIFSIPDSDKYRTAIRHMIYSNLNCGKDFEDVFNFIEKNKRLKDILDPKFLKEIKDKGIRTHHIGIVDRETGEVYEEGFPENLTNLTLVKRFNIYHPERIKIQDKFLYDYHKYHGADNYVIPLENILRFGITPQSSIYKKYLKADEENRKKILTDYGVDEFYPWQIFDVPKFDFTTKYEPQDRAVSFQEALNISGIGGESFKKLINLTYFCGIFIYLFFKRVDLILWDLKLEFAKSDNEIILVDTVDTDSVRVTYDLEGNHVHFNKQAVRDYYIKFHKDWVEAVNKAKEKSKTTGEKFQEILQREYGDTPHIEREFLELQAEKQKNLVEILMGNGKNRLKELARIENEKYFNQ